MKADILFEVRNTFEIDPPSANGVPLIAELDIVLVVDGSSGIESFVAGWFGTTLFLPSNWNPVLYQIFSQDWIFDILPHQQRTFPPQYTANASHSLHTLYATFFA